MTGLRRAFFAPALFCLALSAVFALFAVAFQAAGFRAAAVFVVFAALFAAAAFFMALALLRSLSRFLQRIGESALRGAPLPESPASLEKALREAAAALSLRAERAEAEGRQYLAILNGMSEAVLAMDRGLALRLANSRACSLFALGEWRGCSLLKATRSTELEAAARKVLEEGRPSESEFRLRGAYGEGRSERIFRVFAAPMSPSPGRGAEGAVIVLEDVTRISRLEQVRKDFVANVSHELRTPIQLIKGFSEALLDGGAHIGEEQARRSLGIIGRNARAMENLTNDLLVIAGLENQGGASREMSAQPLAPLFAEAALSVGPLAEKRGARIDVDCPADLEAAVHGPFVIRALINLLDNAIKYSPKKPRVRALAYRKGGSVALEVRDEGIGISSEHMGRIFERFYRVDRAHSRESGGTGLGLSIVRHIALLHGGTAEAESHAGEGSTFRIVLPAEPPNAPRGGE